MHEAISVFFELLDTIRTYILLLWGEKKNLSQNSINESLSHSHCGLYAHLSCPSLSAGVLWHPERFLRYF